VSAHTPGPWRVDATCGGLAIESERHGNIGLVNLARASKADARLIAAAPELLDVARKALVAWTGDGPPIDLDELRAAIAKATGAA